MAQLTYVSRSVGLITLQNPPVNALSAPVRQGIVDTVERALNDPKVKSVVICGQNGIFCGGADIKEFHKNMTGPPLVPMIHAIEAMNKPVVAAIEGGAFGGGLEVALGCHYRIAHSKARLGLPEVTLGLLPGAGGTQRLPRLIGVPAALSLITTGRHVTAAEALQLGILDQVTDHNVVDTAVKFAQSVAGKYVYQPMTNVCQLPSTTVPAVGTEYSNTMDLSVSLAERFLKLAPCFQSPPHLESPKYCVIADLFVDDYIVKRINGKMCYVQRPPPPLPEPPHPPTPPPPAPATPQMPQNPAQPRQQVKPAPPTQHAPALAPAPVQPVQQVYSEHKHPSPVDKIKGPKMDHCSSPSSSEDSGINALGLHYLESCEEESEEEEDDELSTDGNSSPGSLWDQDDCSLLSPSKSMIEIIEKIETTV